MSNDSPDNSIVRTRGVGKRVATPDEELVILQDISFDIAQGETLSIVGTSGSGKTTLLGLLAGLDVPSTGNIWIDGVDITAVDEDGRARIRSRYVGFVFQSFQLLANLTAQENVMLPLELAGREDARARAAELLGQVGLGARRTHYPNQLSGGEQQRVALARAFVTRPRILFADEPTGNLDQKTGGRIIDLLFDLNTNHETTLVLVTHDEALAGRCARTMVLEEGRIR